VLSGRKSPNLDHNVGEKKAQPNQRGIAKSSRKKGQLETRSGDRRGGKRGFERGSERKSLTWEVAA